MKKKIIVGILVSVSLLLAAYFTFTLWLNDNYAAEVEKSLGQALVENGAKKICSRGDSGRGTDNKSPWIHVYYEFNQDKEKARETVKRIASSQGYKLVDATLQNPGPIVISEKYISDWMYDTAKKPSPYPDLKDESIDFKVTVSNNRVLFKNGSCSVDSDQFTKNSTIILRFHLPEYK